jgi:hypothetical protein
MDLRSMGSPVEPPSDVRFAPFLMASAAIDCDHPAVRHLARDVCQPHPLDTIRHAYETLRDRYPHFL